MRLIFVDGSAFFDIYSLFDKNNALYVYIFTLTYRVWSSIVIVHEKIVFFLLRFFKIMKKGSYYFEKKKLRETRAFWLTRKPYRVTVEKIIYYAILISL